ncbi:MAG: DUF2236 domain-containing protein [Acidimicrobiia bacterium]|nr:DUF2236 domain-containing protein [Acidimicrobiia bacterium]
MSRIAETIDLFRNRVVGRTTSLFAHAPNPLERTLEYRGDVGLMGPGSVSWQVIGDVASFFGGIRALLIQAAHPEVAASLRDHSRYKDDPLGRLSRTSNYVTATTFGAMPEVEQAVEMVRRAHRPVRGESHRGRSYSAGAPELAAWVHNVLTDSFLKSYMSFGPEQLSVADQDRFVTEQAQIGRLLNADPIPETAADLENWIVKHPDIGGSPGMDDAIDFLRNPPLPLTVLPAYKTMGAAAAATIPKPLRKMLGVPKLPTAITAGRRTSDFLRWSLGSSPAWHVALVRSGAEIPEGLFTRTFDEAGLAG